MAIFDPSTWFGGGASPYGSPLPGAANPYNPAAAFQYDPATLRRAAISNALLSAGAAMLGQGPSRMPQNFGTSLGQGVAAGLQGADTGVQQAMQRQQFAQQTAAGGQAYQAGALNNVFTLQKINSILDYMGQPRISLSDLQADPAKYTALLTNPPPASDAAAPTAAPPAAVAPQLGGVNPMAPAPSGGPNIPTNIGNLPNTGTAPLPVWTPPGAAAPAAAAAPAPDQSAGADAGAGAYDLSTPEGRVQMQLDRAAPLQVGSPEMYNAIVSGIKSSPDYIAMSASQAAKAQKAADYNSPQYRIDTGQKLSSGFEGEDAVKTMNAVRPIMPTIAAAAKGDTTVSDAELISSVVRVWNPGVSSVRPNMVASIGDVQNVQGLQARIEAAFSGGAPLSPADRAYLVKSAADHYAEYVKDYNATRAAYTKRAAGTGLGLNESDWNSQAAGADQPQFSEGQTATNAQGQRIVFKGGQWVPLQ